MSKEFIDTLALLETIRDVHSQHADDLCFMDIDRIFAAAGLPVPDRSVGDKKAMLKNCERFIRVMCQGGRWRSYAELEAEVARLTAALHAARAHPDYQYLIVPAGHMGALGVAMRQEDGWEQCVEANVVPGDECWRRRKEGT